MKEQSQIDAMRAAVRGDIERSRARRGSESVAQPEPAPVEIRATPAAATKISMRRAEPTAAIEEPLAAAAEPEPPPGPRHRRLLRRLFRR